jgi:hypothetical protein
MAERGRKVAGREQQGKAGTTEYGRVGQDATDS